MVHYDIPSYDEEEYETDPDDMKGGKDYDPGADTESLNAPVNE